MKKKKHKQTFTESMSMKMEMIKKFNQLVEVECYSPTTIKTYRFHIERFVRCYGENPPQENIIKHLLYWKNKGYSSTSLNIAKAALLYYYRKILKQEITIDLPQIIRKKALPRPVDREIIIKLINNTKNLKHRILIELLYSGGLRLSEVIKIEWTDLDYIRKTVRINQGKGKKDRLTLLSDVVIQHLIDYKEQRMNKDSIYVFDSMARPTTHISKKTVQKVLENSSKKAKLDLIVTPHQLRHSFATHSLENGVDIRHIQVLLGHSSPKTTMIYTKVTKNNLSKIQSPLDSLDLTGNEDVKTNENDKKDCVGKSIKSNP